MNKKLTAIVLSLIITVQAPFLIGQELKAFAVETGISTEVTSSNTQYNQLEMPVISIITSSGSNIGSEEEIAKISIINDVGTYEMSDMDVSIKLRGNSSMYADKQSYKLKFDKKQNLLNIGDDKGKPWLLIANCYDTSLLRNLTAYKFADLLTGMPYTQNCRSVEVYLNGEYQGVYLLCEDVNINNNRISITEAPDEVENNGYLVEMSRYAGDNKIEIDTQTYKIDSDLSKTESIKEQQKTYISGYITEAYNALKSGNESDVEKYINLESLVDIYIGNEIVKNVDVGWDSFYMYKDVNGKLCFGPMWDFDLAMGNADCAKGFKSWKGLNPYHVLNVNANSNPWFCHALSSKWFRELVITRWNELQTEINNIPKTVITEAESNFNSYCRNFEKWDVLGRQVYIEPKEISDLKTFKDHYTYLSNWLNNRIEWLTDYINSNSFENGILVDEENKELNEHSNLIALSSILAYPCTPNAEITYEMSKNTGMTCNVIKGGTESWEIQMIASGFMMEKDVEYVLSFDYTSSKDGNIPFAIQQNYEPYTEYFIEDLKSSSTTQHYETTVKVPQNESNAVLVFNLGDSSFSGETITVDNMSLLKKASTPETKAGDLNADSSIDSIDFALLKSYLLGSIKDFPADDDLAAADLNRDNSIDAIDFSILKRYLLGDITVLPIK